MAEYIEREAAIKKIREEGVRGEGYADSEREDDVVNVLEAIPAADVAPVVRGRWIHDYNNVYGCSECLGRESMSPKHLKPYCPNCGAKMEG